jgi:hypothetical protein
MMGVTKKWSFDMCGLVSVVTKHRNGLSKEQCEIFDTLLFVDQLRGADSTGVFVTDNRGNLDLAKEASNATEFRKAPEYKSLMSTALRAGTAIVGHNRAATKGNIVDANAHPFVVDDRITLVHNGTLWGDHKKLANTEVDSHAIAHTIHKHDDDVEAALKELTGAYALIWHDFKNQSLNFVRNTQRPLHWLEVPGAWLWASEANMLEWMVARFNLKPTSEICLLPEGVLTTFNMNNGEWEVDQKKLQLTPPASVYVPSTYHGNTGYGGDTDPLADDDEYAMWYGAEIKSHQQALPPVAQPTERALATKRIEGIEEGIGYSFGSHFTWQEFQVTTGYIKDNSYHAMKCKEVVEVSITGPALGYFVYGILEDYPDIMVKVHVAAGVNTEIELMDMCLNERRMLTNLKTRRWALYNDVTRREANADGYGMYIADGMKEIVQEAAANEAVC